MALVFVWGWTSLLVTLGCSFALLVGFIFIITCFCLYLLGWLLYLDGPNM